MTEHEIGSRLKNLRERRKLTLRGLSRGTGIAVSFLSALERGQNNVSVGKLKTILDELGTNLGSFFASNGEAPAKVVYHADELTEISGQARGISFKDVAAGRPGRALQMLIERYEPGCDTGPEMYRHESEEAGVVLKGTLELTVDGTVYRLGPGDAYYFDSRRPHRFRNTGKKAVEAISCNTPPGF
jgi:transcriptional regulator with XRE-family HTH domain